MSGFYPDKNSPIEILDDQNKLQSLWNRLDSLPRINVSAPIDIATTSIVTTQNADVDKIEGIRGKPATEIRAVGLDKGKLVAIKDKGGHNNQWQTFHLVRIKKDGRFATELPLSNSPLEIDFSEKPIVVYPDDEKSRTIRLQKTPAGFKISFSSRNDDPAYTRDGDENYLICSPSETEFFQLDQDLSSKAEQLNKEINK